MSITDKELLTFCNLANLEMEYANLQYDEDLDTGETIKRNHTIYSLLSQERRSASGNLDIDSDDKDENSNIDREYIINLARIFKAKTEIADDENKKENEKELEEEQRELYNRGKEIIRSAPIVFDYLDNEELNKFLKEWEIIYAENLKGIVIDFLYDAYVDVYSKEKGNKTKDEFLKESGLNKVKYDQDKRVEISVNLKKDLKDILEKEQETISSMIMGLITILGGLSAEPDNFLYDIYKENAKETASKIALEDSQKKTENKKSKKNKRNKAKSKKNKKVKKVYEARNKSGKRKFKEIPEDFSKVQEKILKNPELKVEVETFFKKKFPKINEYLKRRKIFISNGINEFAKVGDFATKLSILISAVLELEKLYTNIENFLIVPKMSLENVKIRKSDVKTIILKKENKYVVVFNDFTDKILRNYIESGIMTNDLLYLITSIMKKISKKLKIKEEILSLEEGVEFLKTNFEQDITFIGFGNGSCLAALVAGIYKKEFKVLEKDSEDARRILEIYNFTKKDIEMVNGEVITSEIVFGKMHDLITGALYDTLAAKIGLGVAIFTEVVYATVSGMNLIAVLVSGLAQYLFMGIIVGMIFLFVNILVEKYLINEVMDFLIENKYLDKKRILNIEDIFIYDLYFVNEKIKDKNYELINDKFRVKSPTLKFIFKYMMDKFQHVSENVIRYKGEANLEYDLEKDENEERVATKYFGSKIIDIFFENEEINFSRILIYERGEMEICKKEEDDDFNSKIDYLKGFDHLNNLTFSQEENERILENYLTETFKEAKKAVFLFNILKFYYYFQENIDKTTYTLKENGFEYICLRYNLGNCKIDLKRVNNFKDLAYKFKINQTEVKKIFKIEDIGKNEIKEKENYDNIFNIRDRKEIDELKERIENKKISHDEAYNRLRKYEEKIVGQNNYDDEYMYFPFIDGDKLTENINKNYSKTSLSKYMESYFQ